MNVFRVRIKSKSARLLPFSTTTYRYSSSQQSVKERMWMVCWYKKKRPTNTLCVCITVRPLMRSCNSTVHIITLFFSFFSLLLYFLLPNHCHFARSSSYVSCKCRILCLLLFSIYQKKSRISPLLYRFNDLK